MRQRHRLSTVKVGNGRRHFANAVVRPRTEAETMHGLLQQAFARIIELAVLTNMVALAHRRRNYWGRLNHLQLQAINALEVPHIAREQGGLGQYRRGGDGGIWGFRPI